MVKGKLTAASEEAATELLDYAGYRAINLKLVTPLLSLDKLSESLSRIKPTEIVFLYRQLALLLESGIDIITSFELLQGRTPNQRLKSVLTEIISDLRSGKQLSMALGKHPKIFHQIHCRLLHVGEQSGSLETMLRQIADHVEKEITAKKGVKSALMYPAMASVMTIVIAGILITFVLPSIGRMYTSLGTELPLLTRILMNTGEIASSYGAHIFLGVLAVAGLAFAYTRTARGRYKLDKLALSLPQVGQVNHLSELARCCRSISLLFRAGLPLTEIMSLVIQSSGNRVMAKALTDIQQDMFKGEGLSKPMEKNDLFLPMMVQMVKVGEETGKLDTTLLAVAQSYEAEVEDKIRSLIVLIQPTMTIIIGLIIGVIALSLASAMYSVYGQGF